MELPLMSINRWIDNESMMHAEFWSSIKKNDICRKVGGTRKCSLSEVSLVEKLRVRFLWAPLTDHCITLIPWHFYLICPYLVNIFYSFTLNSWSGGQSPYLNEVCLASCLWKACHNVLLLETLDCSSRSPSNSTELNNVSPNRTWNDSCMIQDLKQEGRLYRGYASGSSNILPFCICL